MYSLIVYRDVYKMLLKCCNNFSDFNCKKKVLEKTFFLTGRGVSRVVEYLFYYV